MKILRPILWMLCGALLLVALFTGLWAYDLSRWPSDPTVDGWERVGPIGLSPRWTISFFQQPAHPFLAEYHYKIQLFRNTTAQESEFVAELPLAVNTGGRTELALYVHLDASAQATHVEFVQEQMERVNPHFKFRDYIALDTAAAIDTAPVSAERRLLGHFNGQSIPLKFIPADQ